jgi:hypothetical protein
MQLSEFGFKILVLFVPGIVCAYLYFQLTNHAKETPFEFSIFSFVTGLLSYVILGNGLEFARLLFPNISWPRASADMLIKVSSVPELHIILLTTLTAIVLAIVLVITKNHKIITKISHVLGISYKFGEMDVWGFFFNLKDVKWVTIRDKKNKLAYLGWVEAFSDNSRDAEILLSNVHVYDNDTGTNMYQIDMVYLSLEKDQIEIEWRNAGERDKKQTSIIVKILYLLKRIAKRKRISQ